MYFMTEVVGLEHSLIQIIFFFLYIYLDVFRTFFDSDYLLLLRILFSKIFMSAQFFHCQRKKREKKKKIGLVG